MVEIKGIKDRDSLYRWLQTQPINMSILVSTRAALRFLVHYWEYLLTLEERDGVSALPVLFPNLISEVAARSKEQMLPEQLQSAARWADTFAARQLDMDPAAQYSYSFALANQNSAALDASEAAISIESWEEIRNDCANIAMEKDLVHLPLWQKQDDFAATKWEKSKLILSHDKINWSFWIKWYEAALNGEPLNWKMLERIALIPSEDWEQGPKHVNALIAEIEAEFASYLAPKIYTKSIQQAVAQNRDGLAPQIEALSEILAVEIERLRGKNPVDEIEQEEVNRLKSVFEKLHSSIARLGELLPSSGEPTKEGAEEIEGLLKLYAGEFKNWPRENAKDMVDSTVRVALVGMTAGVVTLFGAPALVGVAIGGIAFGGKKLAGVAKALKDSSSGGN